jgi:hypothetical protein
MWSTYYSIVGHVVASNPLKNLPDAYWDPEKKTAEVT